MPSVTHSIPSLFLGFLGSSAGKESACNVGGLGSVPELGRSPGEGNGYPLQYSDLENSMDCIVHGGHKESDRTEQLSLSKPFNFNEIYSNVISDITNMCSLLIFFSASLARGLMIFLVFSKYHLPVLLNFSSKFLLSISLTSTRILIISF